MRFGRVAKLAWIAMATASLMVLITGCGPRPQNPAENQAKRTIPNPPSYVIVLANDVGWGDLGCYGQEKIATPNVDRIAKNGLRLLEFYCGDPLGEGSAWSLLTGFDLARAKKREEGGKEFRLEKDQATIAEVLGAAGYQTGFVGTWTLGDNENLPDKHGFAKASVLLPAADGVPVEFPQTMWRDGQELPIEANAEQEQGNYVTDLIAAESAAFLQGVDPNHPFLLFVVMELPHGSKASPSYAQYAEKEWSDAQKAYAARIAEFDRGLGMIQKQLDEVALTSRTSLVFTSTCGPRGADEETLAFFEGTGGLRGSKTTPYEGGLRVPCVVQSPTLFMTNVERDDAAAAWDLMPTVIETSGAVRKPQSLDGVSIAPILRGGIGNPRNMFYWECWVDGKMAQAVRIDDWKVVRQADKMSAEECELYDIRKDPEEKKDVSKEHPDVVARFLR